MSNLPSSVAASRQVEVSVRNIETLSVTPAVLASALELLKSSQTEPSRLRELIESDPALTTRILYLAGQNGVDISQSADPLGDIISKLDIATLRDTILSLPLETDNLEADNTRGGLNRIELQRFSLAVAIAAGQIAEFTGHGDLKNAAFTAGMLNNIGKLALLETMPKSMEIIVQEASMLGGSDLAAERKYLGTDHTVIGKRLAEKWNLPEDIVYAIWLHRAGAETLEQTKTAGSLTAIVQLAYALAAGSGIGQPGSFENPPATEVRGGELKITAEQLQSIQQSLADQTQRRIELSGLDKPLDSQRLSGTIREMAVELAGANRKLTEENSRLAVDRGYAEFVRNFLKTSQSGKSAIEVASEFARQWQHYYKTGPVCIYLIRPEMDDLLDAVALDSQSHVQTLLLNAPSGNLLPSGLSHRFGVIDAGENLNWLTDQLDIELDISRTKIAPIIAEGQAVAAIVWQGGESLTFENQHKQLQASTSLAGPGIAGAYAHEKQQHLAEEFAALLSRLEGLRDKLAQTEALDGLAEMAAGAAHELNNPLAVISGRAQMLEGQESDPEKKTTLQQITQNADEISKIVQALMEFAKPASPSPRMISPAVLLDTAVDNARHQLGLDTINVQLENIEELRDIYVDSEQIIRALANIIANAHEASAENSTPVRVIGTEQDATHVRLQIIDEGAGMDAETLNKARQPFFSFKPAGRKRGMGLSMAQRLLTLNRADIHINSSTQSGTTVTILLPCNERANS